MTRHADPHRAELLRRAARMEELAEHALGRPAGTVSGWPHLARKDFQRIGVIHRMHCGAAALRRSAGKDNATEEEIPYG